MGTYRWRIYKITARKWYLYEYSVVGVLDCSGLDIAHIFDEEGEYM